MPAQAPSRPSRRRREAAIRSQPTKSSAKAASSSARCRADSPRWWKRPSSRWGQPNGYVLGQEGGGAFIVGLRYGDGTLYTKNAGDRRVFWEGPSIGFDTGGEGARTMMLVYNLPATDAIYQRFAGIDGSAYFIGGFGMTALTADNIVLVPIRSGVGLRLGANIGYLKFTPKATWNPFVRATICARSYPENRFPGFRDRAYLLTFLT